MDLLRNIGLVWAQYRAFRAALAELETYSERELDELGVTRADVPRVAYEEAERRVAALVAGPGAPEPRRVPRAEPVAP